ncbi:MAG: HEPN domain-containing protein, partial [Saprospiraceae bacterium]|nr:HEPN domain-containing protein [Saprospiraceae bacterium]
FTRWSTSCLNLLDKLSISSNRFVSQFEIWVTGGPGKKINIGAALGVLQSAKDEYLLGMAVDYHLSVSASVFTGFLDEASYLLEKGYLRAAAVIIGAALEEGLKSRARSITLNIGEKETLNPLIDRLKKDEIGLLNEFEAKQLHVVAKMRNDAAHGGDFNYTKAQVEEIFKIVEVTLHKLLMS